MPAQDLPDWIEIQLYPKLTEAEGQPLALWVVATVDRNAKLVVGATKSSRDQSGRLWINGQPAWPDQSLEFIAYGTPELTRSKVVSLLSLLTTGWRWPLLLVDLAITLTFITFVPALLVTAALQRPPHPR